MLRPAWTGAGTRIWINGARIPGDGTPSRFFRIVRAWHEGDSVEIEFDMPMRLQPLDEHHPHLVALMTGPLVLFPVAADDRAVSRNDLLLASRVGREQ